VGGEDRLAQGLAGNGSEKRYPVCDIQSLKLFPARSLRHEKSPVSGAFFVEDGYITF
jgi:hypothetical protein